MSAVNTLAIILLESAPSPRAWGCGFTPVCLSAQRPVSLAGCLKSSEKVLKSLAFHLEDNFRLN